MVRIHPGLQAFKPSSDDPFDYVKAAHLLNRAGFGGKEEEIEQVLELGPEKSVDWLMDFPDAPAEEQSATDVPDLSMIDGGMMSYRDLRSKMVGKTPEEKKEIQQMLQRNNRQAVQATIEWWMKRMMHGPYPLQEKLTLFWHGHFATSAKDERSAWLMWRQNELHRTMGAGNIKAYVHAISHDPAMLDYLNNQQNHKNHPNENYARELMELFTLGIGNYTENDIKQAARAFTGWAHDGDDFIFRRPDHDDGAKTFFGRSGNFNGDDIVEIIFQHPECPKYFARKLMKYFVQEEPDAAHVDSLGQLLKDSNWELRPVIRTILTSKAFYSEKAVGGQIKSPVQLVVGTLRMLDLKPGGGQPYTGVLNQMGQMPLFPPNVKGWPGGHMWISTSTLFVRYNTCGSMVRGASLPAGKLGKKGKVRFGGENKAASEFDPKNEDGSAEDVADRWIVKLIQRPIEKEKRQILIEALGDRPTRSESVKKMVELIVSMPEYQLC